MFWEVFFFKKTPQLAATVLVNYMHSISTDTKFMLVTVSSFVSTVSPHVINAPIHKTSKRFMQWLQENIGLCSAGTNAILQEYVYNFCTKFETKSFRKRNECIALISTSIGFQKKNNP